MRPGDRVRVTSTPPGLPQDDLNTQSVFEACVGKVFVVQGIEDNGWVELLVESVTGQAAEKIWIEPEHLCLVE